MVDLVWVFKGEKKILPLSKLKKVASHILMFSCILNFLQKKERVCQRVEEKVKRIVIMMQEFRVIQLLRGRELGITCAVDFKQILCIKATR